MVLSTAVVALLAATWGYLRLVVFSDSVLPLTYVLPLLACIWTRRRAHVWAMGVTFVLFALVKAARLSADADGLTLQDEVFIGATLLNIAIGAFVVHGLIRYRERLDEQAAIVTAQNAELQAQAEELMQQNEEIRAQAEELAQQNEEINGQAEELTRQNDELHLANERLGVRDAMLQDLLQSTRGAEAAALAPLCHRALALLGAPTDRVLILERRPAARLQLTAQAENDGAAALPADWPVAGSLAGLVLRDERTAYVSDFAAQPDLAAPFTIDSGVRSMLATPLRVDGAVVGVLAACSRKPAHWSDEQFQLLEWIAAMCSHLTTGIRARALVEARTAELEAANLAKDDFLAMLSHELRTPLTPVLAAAGVMASDSRLPEDVREDLAMIRRNVTIQSRLIDDLLDLTRIERRKLELNAQPCRPAALLRDAAGIAMPDLDAKEQTLAIRCEVPEQWRISGDSARLQQILWNLLQNATKFSPPRTHIQLTAHPAPGAAPRVVIAVEDQGPGIPPADVERIFRPFEQIRNGRRVGRETGLGLGLAIARAIAELHLGRLTVVAGSSGQGARFVLELPLVPAHPAAGVAAAGRDPGAPGAPEPLAILLVEDHSDTGRVITQLLKGAGHDVVHSTTATDALARFSRGHFNLVISDIGLPDESGLVLMKKLRELQPALAGICMTGYGMESDQRACLDAGFSEHLAKPVDVQRLHAAIDRVARAQPRNPRSPA